VGASWDGVDDGLHQAAIALMQAVSDAGGQATITSTLRTLREQSFLWKRYQSGNSGGLPAAPPGHSAHEYGWAFDMVVSPQSWQFDVGRVWKSWGGAYGGKRDPVHFELPGAGAAAWQLGEQQAAVAATTPTNGVGWLPARWKSAIYSLEDFGISMIPGVDYITLIASLLKLGYPDSQILAILTEPVEKLHEMFPSIPF
jgi:hypothetical protein